MSLLNSFKAPITWPSDAIEITDPSSPFRYVEVVPSAPNAIFRFEISSNDDAVNEALSCTIALNGRILSWRRSAGRRQSLCSRQRPPVSLGFKLLRAIYVVAQAIIANAILIFHLFAVVAMNHRFSTRG